MIRATPTSTADFVAFFISEEILHPFGPPEIVSENAGCFSVEATSSLVKEYGVCWRLVAEYGPCRMGGRIECSGPSRKRVPRRFSMDNQAELKRCRKSSSATVGVALPETLSHFN